MSKHTEFRAKAAQGDEPGTLRGQAVPFGSPIVQGPFEHIIEPGCFDRQLRDPARVKVLWSHDVQSPIGHLLDLTATAAGLDYVARIVDDPTVPDGARAMTLIREGVIDEVSIGFDWEKWTEEQFERGGRTMWRIRHQRGRLRELSPVWAGAAGRKGIIKSAAADLDSPNRVNLRAMRQMLGIARPVR